MSKLSNLLNYYLRTGWELQATCNLIELAIKVRSSKMQLLSRFASPRLSYPTPESAADFELNSTRDRVVISEWIWVTGAGPKNAVEKPQGQSCRCAYDCTHTDMHACPTSRSHSLTPLSLHSFTCHCKHCKLKYMTLPLHRRPAIRDAALPLPASAAAAAATCVRAFCTIVFARCELYYYLHFFC